MAALTSHPINYRDYPVADQTTILAEPFHTAYERHRKAVKSWLVTCDRISPASPDYKEQVTAAWTTCGVGETFWGLERIVVPGVESIGK